MTAWDWIALAVFALCWLGYEPVLRGVSRRTGAITRDMERVRQAWMRAMVTRDVRLLDSQLMGHAINSASFFASANLILIAAVAGPLFGGAMLPDVSGFGIQASPERLEMKLALVTVCLARGLLDFIWSIRQQNYCLALIGAAPEGADGPQAQAFADAAAEVLNPALASFSRGVRGYYFALAAAAWVWGPVWLGAATLAATALLVWRQSSSPAAGGIRRVKALLDAPAKIRRKVK